MCSAFIISASTSLLIPAEAVLLYQPWVNVFNLDVFRETIVYDPIVHRHPWFLSDRTKYPVVVVIDTATVELQFVCPTWPVRPVAVWIRSKFMPDRFPNR